MLSQRSTPVKMSQEAANKLPRWSLLSLLVIFAATGFWSTGIWTMRDASSFGTALAMLTGGPVLWFLPSVADTPMTSAGPMTGWLSALLISLFGSSGSGFGCLSDIAATRLAACLWFGITTAALWYGTWHLARRPEAQPIAFAFGGEASPRDYGRVVADSAVLFFVATFGIVTRQHEALPDTALLAMGAINFYGLTLALRRPLRGCFIAGLASGAAVVSSTLFAGVWLLAISLLAFSLIRAYQDTRLRRAAYTVLGAAAGFLPWPVLAFAAAPEAAPSWFALWAAEQISHFGLAGTDTYFWFARNAVWYLCPVWPFVLWALYSWRRQLRRTHLLLPLVICAAGVPAVVFSSFQASDTVFLTFLPLLSVLASFGLVTVRRSHENELDWFSLMTFSLGTLAAWAYWFAWLTSFAPKMAESVQMLAPGSSPVFDSGFVLALLTTAMWFGFVGWRLTHRPVVIWRGPWLSAAGMTAVAAAVIGLFHTGIDINRSYVPVIESVSGTLVKAGFSETDCAAGEGFTPGLQALFQYYGGIRVLRHAAPGSCRFTITRGRSDRFAPEALARPASRPHTDETFIVTLNR